MTEVKQVEISISDAKADLIQRLSGEVARLSNEPAVVSLHANQAFLAELVRVAAAEGEQQMPASPQIALKKNADGPGFKLILTAQG